MTSNQIAFEATQVQKQANEWTKEHNEQYREETKRHNQEMEKLQQNSINAQEHQNRIQENWNQWQQQWQEEYQARFREYELAQEDKKIAIQEDLARLEERKVLAEESYKSAQEANLAYMQSIASDQLALEESWKTWSKEFQQKSYELNEFQAKIKAKEVEYNMAMQHEQNIIASNRNIMQQDYNYALLNWEREKTNRSLENQLKLGYLNYNIGLGNLDISKSNLELYAKKVRAENFQSYTSGLFGRSGIIPGSIDAFSKFIPATSLLNSGGAQIGTKITKEAAEQVLFGKRKF